MGETGIIDATVGSLTDPFHSIHMGATAENLAESHSISREEQDEFALESHRRAQAAIEAGKFDCERVPVPVKVKRQTVEFQRDEHVRAEISLEGLGKLKPAFRPDGTVTAGNAAGVNDAAAAVVVMSAERAQELGAADPGAHPGLGLLGRRAEDVGIGSVPAVRKVLERAGKTLGDVDVIELNEAFASRRWR